MILTRADTALGSLTAARTAGKVDFTICPGCVIKIHSVLKWGLSMQLKKVTRAIIEIPIIGQCVLFVYRVKTAAGHFRKPMSNLLQWLFRSNEITNFTFYLEEINKRYLASLIADIMTISFEAAAAYIKEIEDDEEIRKHIETDEGFYLMERRQPLRGRLLNRCRSCAYRSARWPEDQIASAAA